MKATAQKTAPEGQKGYVRLHQAGNVLLPDQHFSNELPLRKIQRFKICLILFTYIYFSLLQSKFHIWAILGCHEEQPIDPLFPEEFLDYRFKLIGPPTLIWV